MYIIVSERDTERERDCYKSGLGLPASIINQSKILTKPHTHGPRKSRILALPQG